MCLMQLFWINKSMNLYKYKPPPSALFQKPLFTKCILPMISEISAPNWCISATTSNIKSKISWICLARIPYLQIKVNHDNQQNNKYPRHFCSFINTQPSHHYKLTLEHHKFSIVITYPITKRLWPILHRFRKKLFNCLAIAFYLCFCPPDRVNQTIIEFMSC